MKRQLLVVFAFASIAVASDAKRWVATWGASPAPQMEAAEMQAHQLVFADQTLREIIHTSIGSNSVRVRLSNAYSKQALEVNAAHIALRAKGADIIPQSDRVLTFNGRPSAMIPANALLLSDPVNLDVPAGVDVAVSLFVKTAVGAGTHYAAQQTSYIAQGDETALASMRSPATITSWVFLTGVDVLAAKSVSSLVTFGDSITDGAQSTVDANARWPDILAARLRAKSGRKPIGIVDAGIGGNRILHDASNNIQFGVNALARFDRDVLAQSGVKYVIVLEGINDLGHAGTSAPLSETVSAEDIIAGLTQMAERAHDKGLTIYGSTLTPFDGTVFPGYFTPEKEVKRKAVNEWLRSNHVFDGVIDFDKAVRDPDHPDHMLPAYDSGDHLHPNDAGYRAMGEAVNLSLFS